VISLTTISGALALLIAYLRVYGPTPWGIESFTRTVGQVFEPVVILSLGLKTLLFSLSVATIPVTSRLVGLHNREHAPVTVPQGTVRLFVMLIVIEVCSLTAEFY
jgi:phospholipid/cholesterol/gamma-HCH transport system permease protein